MTETPYKRILVRATNWVGDAVMSLPALQMLRVRFPDSHIAILARPWVADLYRHEPFCDEVILFDAPRGWHGLTHWVGVARDLKLRRFDCAILLQNAFEAAAVAWLARIPLRIGYDRDGRGALLNCAVSVPKEGEIPRHQRFYYLELLKRAGLIGGYPNDPQVAFTPSESRARRGRQLLIERGAAGAVIGIAPGAAFGGAKRWLPERFAEAAVRTIEASGLGEAVVFGSGQEAELGAEITAMIAKHGIKAHNLAGATKLSDFVDMASVCDVFLTNDSGSMHVASALGVPTVAVFGPTDEFATGPAGTKSIVIREPVECAPCHLRECPIDHRCMTRVSAERAADAALQLLKQVS